MKLGLTGSIGMGKSTVAGIFQEFGAQIWNADQAVKALYVGDAGLHALVKKLAPKAFQTQVDFEKLRAAIRADDKILPALEAYIHPKVRQDRAKFLESDGVKLCDIPLLYENKMEGEFDFVVVVSAPFEVQLARVLARNTMSRADFDLILSRQMADADKRAQADFVIDTATSLEETCAQVQNILQEIGVFNA